jgi:hypothetical protein
MEGLGSLFSFLGGGAGGGGLGAIAGLVGAGFQFAGQQESMKGAEAAALQSSIQAGYQQKQAVNQATLVNMMAQRQQLQQVRTAQMARSQAEAAGVNQGAAYGSALPGAYGGISGTTTGNIQGIGMQQQTYMANFGLEQGIYQSKLLQAQAQSQIYAGQGEAAMGGDIASMGKALGQLIPSFGSMFNSTFVNPSSASQGDPTQYGSIY